MGKKVLLVAAEFNSDIVGDMIGIVEDYLRFAKVCHDVCRVPGALEIPAAMGFAIIGDKIKYDGYVALGCVVKGKTDHYEHVSRECMRGIMDISIQHMVPIGNGVITADNLEDAKSRSQRSNPRMNVALGAVKALVSMIGVYRGFV